GRLVRRDARVVATPRAPAATWQRDHDVAGALQPVLRRPKRLADHEHSAAPPLRRYLRGAPRVPGSTRLCLRLRPPAAARRRADGGVASSGGGLLWLAACLVRGARVDRTHHRRPPTGRPAPEPCLGRHP